MILRSHLFRETTYNWGLHLDILAHMLILMSADTITSLLLLILNLGGLTKMRKVYIDI